MDPEHTMRVEGRVVTCTCGYSVAFPEAVERGVAAAVARKHLATVQAPLIKAAAARKQTND